MKTLLRLLLCLAVSALLLVGAAGCLASPESPAAPGGNTEVLDAGSPFKHYFAQLTDKEKTAYNAILSAATDFPNVIEIPALTRDEMQRMYTAVLYDNPELFFLDNASTMRQSKKRTYFYPSYRLNAEDYAAMRGRCSTVAAQILDEARQQPSAFARERVVHDRLIAGCRYTDSKSDPYRSTIYGVLVGGAASCEGYAKAAKYLLDQLEIPCYVVSGNSTPPGSTTSSHMWNVVQLEGAYYHLDLTWDDPVVESGGDMIRYAYFNVTDAQIRKTHTDFDAGHACTADAQNFYVHENLLFHAFGGEEKERVVRYAADTIDAGSDGFQLRFADEETYRSALSDLIDNEGVYTLLKQINEKADTTFATDRVSYINTDADYSIEIMIETQQGGDENNGYAEN